MKKRLCSLMTALCLVLTLLPAEALATEDLSVERDPVEHAAADSIAQEDTALESEVPEDAAPEDTVLESTVLESTVLESTDPESTIPESTISESGAAGSVSDVPETTGNEAQTDLPAETGIFSGGTGTAEDPYLISGLDELKAFRDSVNAGETYNGEYVRLTDDIDLGGEEWTPIGGGGTGQQFWGTFDGDGYTISNLKISRGLSYTAENKGIALFGATQGGEIKNFTLHNADVTGSGYVAAVGETDESAYRYALVLASGNTGLEDRVRVALSDGTIGT